MVSLCSGIRRFAVLAIASAVCSLAGATETVNVSFLTPTGGMTSQTYSGLVELTVSGGGQSSGTQLNDAFYVFTDGAGADVTPYNIPGYAYQLTVATHTIYGSDYGHNAVNRIVYDLDAGMAVTPPYLPAYREDHIYRIVVNAGSTAAQLRFGVADGDFSDNSGAFEITVRQLGVVTANDPVVLWAPNHDLVDISAAFTVAVPGVLDPSYTVKVFSNESEIPETGDGTGKYAPDFKDARDAGRGLLARAERAGPGTGRFYIGEISGPVLTTRVILAVVPHDQTPESLALVIEKANAALLDPTLAPFEHGLATPMGPKQ